MSSLCHRLFLHCYVSVEKKISLFLWGSLATETEKYDDYCLPRAAPPGLLWQVGCLYTCSVSVETKSPYFGGALYVVAMANELSLP